VGRTERHGGSILIAEPEAITRHVYRQAFATRGTEVIEAADGRDALVHALIRVPALVITELSALPLIDGTALCELLRRDSQTSRVPILAVTAEMRADQIERATRAGISAMLRKPVPIDEVVRTAGALMDQCRASMARAGASAESLTTERLESQALLGEARSLVRKARSQRFPSTNTPAPPPLDLICPRCGRKLLYVITHYGGVGAKLERWDRFICPRQCGTFEYRFVTCKLRQVT
jgi:CheY-like chemotaxis protein